MIYTANNKLLNNQSKGNLVKILKLSNGILDFFEFNNE